VGTLERGWISKAGMCGKEILQEKGEKLSKIHEEKEGLE
jgi:hypothetical protein